MRGSGTMAVRKTFCYFKSSDEKLAVQYETILENLDHCEIRTSLHEAWLYLNQEKMRDNILLE